MRDAWGNRPGWRVHHAGGGIPLSCRSLRWGCRMFGKSDEVWWSLPKSDEAWWNIVEHGPWSIVRVLVEAKTMEMWILMALHRKSLARLGFHQSPKMSIFPFFSSEQVVQRWSQVAMRCFPVEQRPKPWVIGDCWEHQIIYIHIYLGFYCSQNDQSIMRNPINNQPTSTIPSTSKKTLTFRISIAFPLQDQPASRNPESAAAPTPCRRRWTRRVKRRHTHCLDTPMLHDVEYIWYYLMTFIYFYCRWHSDHSGSWHCHARRIRQDRTWFAGRQAAREATEEAEHLIDVIGLSERHGPWTTSG